MEESSAALGGTRVLEYRSGTTELVIRDMAQSFSSGEVTGCAYPKSKADR